MNPAGETESENLLFARLVVRELTPVLRREPEGSPYDIGLRGRYTKVRIDEILLDVAPEIPDSVILFRDVARPGHFYRMRMEAMEPGPDRVFADPDSWATVIRANFCEAVEAVPGLPEGSPNRITDI